MAVEAERDGGLPNDSVDNAESLVQQFQATSGVIGSPFEGAISSESDVDYYKIEVAGPGLVQINFSTLSQASAPIWTLAVINSDATAYLPLTSRVDSDGATLSADSEALDTELTVQGVDGDPSLRNFYFEGSTNVYKVLDSDLTSGAGTLKVAAAPAKDSGAVLQFDPAYLQTGEDVTLSAFATEAGNYYLKVSKATSFSTASYTLQASVVPTGESSVNDDKLDIKSTERGGIGNRLLEDVWMQGALSGDSDVDYWSFTTTGASDFDIEFVGSGGSDDIPDWEITVTNWGGTNLTDTPLVSAVQFSAGAYATQSFTSSQNPEAKTYLVKVTAAKDDVSALGYSIKVSGANLDLNDTPVSTLGDVSSLSSGAYLSAYTSDDVAVVVKALPATDSGGELPLSDLFSASDADTNQTLSYRISLNPATDSAVTSYIEATVSGETVRFGSTTGMESSRNILLTAEQFESATFVPGATPGDAVMLFQAVDDSGAEDGSGYGALLELVMRVVDSNTRVLVTGTSPGTLTEGSSTSKDLISVKLGAAPAQGETVTVFLDHGAEVAGQYELSFSKASLAFTASNWATEQVVEIRAREDLTKETSQTGELSFRVTSSDSSSAYNGMAVEGFTYDIVDVPNHPATGEVTFSVSGGVLQQGAVLTASDTLADVEGKSNPTVYRWSSSSDGVVWGSGFATGTAVTLANAQVGKYIRVAGEFIDDEGNSERVLSDTTSSVVLNVNDAPTVAVAQTDITATTGSLFSYSLPAGTFADIDAGDTLTYSWKLLDSETGTTASNLPDWLTVASDGRTLSSDGVSASAGEVLYVQVKATDASNASVSDVFRLTIEAADAGAPRVQNLIEDQSVNEGANLNFVFDSGTFVDPENGVLTYQASTTATDDRSLPVWLVFDSATRKFSGTPSNTDVGTLPITVTATDDTGKSVSDVFLLQVNNVNALPTGTLSSNSLAVAAKQGSILTASANISDADGLGEFVYQWQSKTASGDWTNIVGANATTFPLTQAEVGKTVRATVSYEDLMGTTETFVSATPTSTVANVNDAPVVQNAIANPAGLLAGVQGSFQLASDIFEDVDGDTLTLTATNGSGEALPSWLTFDGATRTFALNGSQTASDSVVVKVKASDGLLDASTTFVVSFGTTVAGQVKGWKGAAPLGDVVVKSSDAVDAVTDTSDTDGTFTLLSVPGDQAAIQVTKSGFARGEATQASITLSDVIDNLKVFLNLNLSYEAPFKHVSADFNGDGQHELSDVIGVLKYFLGLDTGTALPGWVFVNGVDLDDSGYPLRWDDSASAGDRLDKTHTQPAPLSVDLTGDTSDLQLIGVLRGDMDGSFFDA
jgi:hypothetical protein